MPIRPEHSIDYIAGQGENGRASALLWSKVKNSGETGGGSNKVKEALSHLYISTILAIEVRLKGKILVFVDFSHFTATSSS
jgi:hypothetical protein